MDHVGRAATTQRQVQGIEHELRAQMRRHRPADHATTPDIEDDGEIEETGPRRDVRDVGDPELIRPASSEPPLDQIGRWAGRGVPDRRVELLPATHAPQPCHAHQPRDALAPDVDPVGRQFGVHARGAVDPARLAVDDLDLGAQLEVRLGPRGERSLPPGVVPAGGDAQRPARGGDAVHRLMRAHELESLDGIELLSRANQAAAFFKMARSSRSVRFSRRSRRSSSRSSVVNPSWRCPSSRSACRTQFRMHWAEGSNWRANSSGVRPFRTSSTIRCRYSGGYGRWLFGIVDLLFRPNHGVSTKPGQLQRGYGSSAWQQSLTFAD